MTSHQGRSAIRDPDANYAFRKDTYHLLGQGSKISDQHPSQQTGVDGHGATRRTKRPTNPDRSEDPQTIYHGEKNGSRTETKFPVSYEPCSSVPQKSKKQKHVPSIIHDGVTRGQITGAETHRQAIDFSWNELMEVPKRQKRSQPPPKTTFVNGYPNPEYLGVHEEDVGKEDDDLQHTEDNDDDYAYSGDDEFDDYEAEDEQKWFDDEDVYDDDYEDEENDVNAKVVKREKVLEGVTLKACSEIRVIQTLPHIGYSPSPSRERLTPLSQRSNTSFLPPLPESPYMATQSYLCVTDTNGTRGTTKSHKGKFRMKKVINSVRRFHGRMYDPGTLGKWAP